MKAKVRAEDLIVVSMPIGDISPSSKNAKHHPDEQIVKIANAIKTFGWDQPIVVDAKLEIIKGHGRRLAAIYLGMTNVPVVVRDDLTEAEADAARISDNVVGIGDLDMDMIKIELERMGGLNVDLSRTGFDDAEIDAILNGSDLDAELDDLLGDMGPPKAPQPTSSSDRTTPKGEEYEETFQVIIDCKDEDDQESIYEEMAGKGYKCRILSM